MSGNFELPSGWAWATLGDVTEPIADQRGPVGNGTFVYVDISSIDRPTKTIAEPKIIPIDQAPSRARQRLCAGDVIVSMTRPNLNAVALVPPELDGTTGSTGFHVLRSRRVRPNWLACLVQTHEFISAMSALVLGVLYPAVRPKDIAAYRFALPPVHEQDRIVGEIEKQLTRLDAAVAALKRVQANLKRYRASVLKAACEGRLVPTEADLARKEGRPYEPAKELLLQTRPMTTAKKKRAGRLWGAGVVPDLTATERATLPDGWAWAKARELGQNPDEMVQVGPMSMRSQDFAETGTPVLNVGCVQWARFDETKLDYMPELKAKQFARYVVQPGDVMFTRSGTVGRCAVVQPHQGGWLMTFHLLRARPNTAICLPEFLRIVFEGAAHIRRQTREASIGTTRAGFNTNLLANLDIPLPPMAEQVRICSAVAQELTDISATEATVTNSIRRADRLRQSILKSAFEGKLVPQDPNDEPASMLLERIRAERAERANSGTRRRAHKPNKKVAVTGCSS